MGDGKHVQYNPHDALYLKTAATPIQPGSKQTGFLKFLLSNISTDEISEGTIFHLSCKDVYGREVFTEYVFKRGNGSEGFPFYSPGTEEPKIMKKEGKR
jgi:hypothetical protein